MPTITTGGTAQDALAANPNRQGFDLQNLSTGDLWWRDDGSHATTSEPSFRLPAGAFYETPLNYRPTGAISIIGATTGQAFAVRSR